MKILGIDTTTKFLCLGIYDGVNIYEYNLELGIKHSALLILTIKRVLGALGWHIGDIDYFACGLGPGSFTGMRVGLSTIKGFSWSLRKPIIGISTLDIVARNVRQIDGYIVAIIDAKRNLIYTGIYRIKDSTFKKINPYMLLTLDELFRKIENIKHRTFPDAANLRLEAGSRHRLLKGLCRENIKQIELLGDAVSLYKEDISRKIKGIKILDKDYWYPKAHNIIELALERIKEKKFSHAFDIEPIYLYPKECQIKNRNP